jgi:hypothetical protein
MTPATLLALDSGLSNTLTVPSAGASTYCLTDIKGGQRWSVAGPGATYISENDATDKWYKTANCT